MTAAARRLRAMEVRGAQRRPRWVPIVAVSATLDAIASGLLLQGAATPGEFPGLVFAVLHVMAALSFCALLRTAASHRWACLTAVLTLPFLGTGIAAVVLGTRGRGAVRLEHRRAANRRRGLQAAAARRLGQQPSACDALVNGNQEERYAVLSALAGRADPEAIALLRWAAAGRDPDLALQAALVLDQVSELAERRQGVLSAPAMLRHAAG